MIALFTAAHLGGTQVRLISGAVGGLDALAAAHQVDSPESFIRCDNLPKRFLLLKRRAMLVQFAKSFGATRGSDITLPPRPTQM